MAQSYDGTFSAAIQHGAKQVSIPLQGDGNNYATLIKRNYIAAPSSYFEPVLPTRTRYSAQLKFSDDLSQANWTKAQTTAATGYSDP
ncbi:hypothetical protein, partial [Salmonella enterica]|uniref:hypothetical protein n=1 Tax=Salmonella enterica TaxID=28901 RepID=UPI0015FCDBA7